MKSKLLDLLNEGGESPLSPLSEFSGLLEDSDESSLHFLSTRKVRTGGYGGNPHDESRSSLSLSPCSENLRGRGEGPKQFVCKECNYWTHSVHRMNAHVLTKKHLKNTGALPKDPDVFECKVCKYTTTVKDRLRVHNNTKKHKENLELQPDLDVDLSAILNPIKSKRIKVVVKRKWDGEGEGLGVREIP